MSMSKKKSHYKKKSASGGRFSKKDIIETLREYFPKPLNHKQLGALLEISDPVLREAINLQLIELKAEGLVEELSHGKYRLLNPKPHVTGTIEIARDGEATLKTDELEQPVIIPPKMLRNAMTGDTVKAYIFTHKRTGRIEGEVTEIIKRARTEFVGTIQIGKSFAFLVPESRKIDTDLYIPIESLNGAKDGEKVIGKIVDWPARAKNPIGKIIKVLGPPGDNSVEMHAIMAEFGLPYDFPSSVLEAAERIPEQIPTSEIEKRRDMRDVLTMTIDPADAKDFDDALSLKSLGNGRWEVGVHIADVAYYVREGDKIDEEAFKRGTSVYLVDRVVPMLPEKLSNEVCSLRPGEEKLTFSAVFEMDEEGTVEKEWFGRAVIFSDKRFAYEEVQEVIETGKGPHSKEILVLDKIAKALRDERFKTGAIDFHSTEVKFRLNDKGEPEGVFIKEQKDAHKLIEDFMLLANRRVAETVGKVFKKGFVYRVHDKPESEKLETFGKFAKKLGYKLNLKEKKGAKMAINRLLQTAEGTREETILGQMAIRTMAKAVYTNKNIGHYGLGFEYYTHFTSPIRRYPDLMVHRLLQKFIDKGRPVEQGLEDACKYSSERERLAADAERASVKFMQVKFLQDKVGEEFDGVVSGMNEWGIYVEILENKCEGMIRLRDMGDDFYSYDEENFMIVGRRKGRKFRLGDEVRIEVKRADLTKKQIDFILAD